MGRTLQALRKRIVGLKMVENGASSDETCLIVATPDCVAEDFGGEIVALNLETGYYFSLRGLAGALWRDLAAGHATQEIVRALSTVRPELGPRASEFIAELVEHGLMRPAASASVVPRKIECGELAARGVTEFSFESYDDMRDLVMTDPVHEVDEEIGWPVRRGETA